jgi:hypothetical protein
MHDRHLDKQPNREIGAQGFDEREQPNDGDQGLELREGAGRFVSVAAAMQRLLTSPRDRPEEHDVWIPPDCTERERWGLYALYEAHRGVDERQGATLEARVRKERLEQALAVLQPALAQGRSTEIRDERELYRQLERTVDALRAKLDRSILVADLVPRTARGRLDEEDGAADGDADDEDDADDGDDADADPARDAGDSQRRGEEAPPGDDGDRGDGGRRWRWPWQRRDKG